MSERTRRNMLALGAFLGTAALAAPPGAPEPDAHLMRLSAQAEWRLARVHALSRQIEAASDRKAVLQLEDVRGDAVDGFFDKLEEIVGVPALSGAGVLRKAIALKLALEELVFIAIGVPPGEEGDAHERLAWSLVQDLVRFSEAGAPILLGPMPTPLPSAAGA